MFSLWLPKQLKPSDATFKYILQFLRSRSVRLSKNISKLDTPALPASTAPVTPVGR